MELELEQLSGTMKIELVGGLYRIETKNFAIFWPIFVIFENSNHHRLVIRTDCDKLVSPPVANRM